MAGTRPPWSPRRRTEMRDSDARATWQEGPNLAAGCVPGRPVGCPSPRAHFCYGTHATHLHTRHTPPYTPHTPHTCTGHLDPWFLPGRLRQTQVKVGLERPQPPATESVSDFWVAHCPQVSIGTGLTPRQGRAARSLPSLYLSLPPMWGRRLGRATQQRSRQGTCLLGDSHRLIWVQ